MMVFSLICRSELCQRGTRWSLIWVVGSRCDQIEVQVVGLGWELHVHATYSLAVVDTSLARQRDLDVMKLSKSKEIQLIVGF
jgi:hypothetical protein